MELEEELKTEISTEGDHASGSGQPELNVVEVDEKKILKKDDEFEIVNVMDVEDVEVGSTSKESSKSVPKGQRRVSGLTVRRKKKNIDPVCLVYLYKYDITI